MKQPELKDFTPGFEQRWLKARIAKQLKINRRLKAKQDSK